MAVHEFHDRSHKLLFDHPRAVRDLMTGFVGGDLAHLLDEETLEQVSSEFIDDSLQASRGDMLWRVRFRGRPDGWVYLLVMIEFQSTVDTHMAVRIAAHVGQIHLRLVRGGQTGPRGELPPVLPIVLYNGRPSWTAAMDVRDLIAAAEGRLAELQPRQGYVLLDVHRMGVGDLPPDNVVSLRVRLDLEPARRLPGMVDDAIRILAGPEYAALRRAFAETIGRMVERSRIGELWPGMVEQLRELAEKGDLTAMRTTFDQRWAEFEEDAVQRGLERGLERGREEGREEGLEQQRTLLSGLAARRFGDGTAADLMAVLREVKDPERLSDMSGLILDCATGRELVAGAERIAGRG